MAITANSFKEANENYFSFFPISIHLSLIIMFFLFMARELRLTTFMEYDGIALIILEIFHVFIVIIAIAAFILVTQPFITHPLFLLIEKLDKNFFIQKQEQGGLM